MRYGSFSVETSYQPSGSPLLGGDAAGVGDQAVDERDVGAVQLALADERRLHVARQEDLRLEAGRGRVGGQRVAGVAGRRDRERRRAESARARDRGRQAARLERVRRVERLVLDVERGRGRARAPSRVRVDQRRPALAERDRRLAVEERQQLAVPPHRRLAVGAATRGATPRAASRS